MDERFSGMLTWIHDVGQHSHLNPAGRSDFYLKAGCELCSAPQSSIPHSIHILEAEREKRTEMCPSYMTSNPTFSDMFLPARPPPPLLMCP